MGWEQTNSGVVDTSSKPRCDHKTFDWNKY